MGARCGACRRRREALHQDAREPKHARPKAAERPTAPCDLPAAECLRHRAAALAAAFPDLLFAIEDITAEGDRVTTRGTMIGTNTGPLAGMPPTGKAVRIAYVDVLRVADGGLVEHWVDLDRHGLLRQLGAIPAEPTVG